MLKYAVDEDFNHEIVRGLERRDASLDILTVQDADLLETHDRDVLAWAAQEGRVLLTHDVRTMPPMLRNGFATGDRCQASFSSHSYCRLAVR